MNRPERPSRVWRPLCFKCGEAMPEPTPHPKHTNIEVARCKCGFQIFFRVTTHAKVA